MSDAQSPITPPSEPDPWEQVPQRATKILGIFARLSKRDGKPIYLNHIPRVSRYLKRNLAHPGLAVLKGWHDRNLPL